MSCKHCACAACRAEHYPGVRFSAGHKFDLQLSAALIAENELAEIFQVGNIELIELKSESYKWERTGNICLEYRSRGEPSGLAKTQAGYWVHDLRRDGKTLVYLMFPIDRLKKLAGEAGRAGHKHKGGGDDGAQDNILLPLSWVLR